jgi:hypothetical protein
MRTTTTDINHIISGQNIPIEIDYPLKDKGDDFKWFMAQPSDWLLDMASAVYDAAYAQVMTMPEMQDAKNLPPTDDWIERQQRAEADAKARITELSANEHRTPEDDMELTNLEEYVNSLIKPDGYNRAQQIAHARADKAKRAWLLPRLIVDLAGRLVCDPNTVEGRERWEKLGSNTRGELMTPLVHVLLLVRYAKN